MSVMPECGPIASEPREKTGVGSSIMHEASSIKHQSSSIKHQASGVKHQASSVKVIMYRGIAWLRTLVEAMVSKGLPTKLRQARQILHPQWKCKADIILDITSVVMFGFGSVTWHSPLGHFAWQLSPGNFVRPLSVSTNPLGVKPAKHV